MNDQQTTVRVWDLPIRAFHWVLAASVLASIATAWTGGNAMVCHLQLGYAACALLAFRLVWGFIGGRWSRFAGFVYAPTTVGRHLRGASRPREHHDRGHSPLGAFSVFAVLGMLALQVATGLFADDEISNRPLSKFVSGATDLALTKWHKGCGQWLIVALIVLHVGAILNYLRVRRRNLVEPMVTGDKRLVALASQSVDAAGSRTLVAALQVFCVGLVGCVVALAN